MWRVGPSVSKQGMFALKEVGKHYQTEDWYEEKRRKICEEWKKIHRPKPQSKEVGWGKKGKERLEVKGVRIRTCKLEIYKKEAQNYSFWNKQ